MAIVETLEVRFAANLGNLGAQIAALTMSLSGLGGVSTTVMAAVAASSLTAGRALDGTGLSAQSASKAHEKLASKLKKTSRAFKSVSSAAKQSAKGIGLHRMDEINLVGDREKNKKGGGSGRNGASGTNTGDLDGLEKIRAMLDQLPGFFERFYSHIRRNMSGVDSWLDKATGGLAGKLVKLLGSAGKNAALSLTDRLLEALNLSRPNLESGSRTLLQGVAEAMRNSASASSGPNQAGSTLAGKLSTGILSGKTSAKNAASSVTLAAKFGGESAKSAASSAGLNLSKGFASGMLSYLDKIKSAASQLASAALSKLKSLLKIASPSKVTFAMGGYFGEGFAGGIAASVAMAGKSASMLAGGAVTALGSGALPIPAESSVSGMVRSAVNEALGDTSITIPLSVDGIRLGEAAIRGINRVTRASGRLMLEI